MAQPQVSTTQTAPKPRFKLLTTISHTMVLVLSIALIVWISYDTFADIPFLENRNYMTFQLWVCIIFMLDFVVNLVTAQDKRRYMRSGWLFFLISIPYLNLVDITSIPISREMMFYLRFVPLLRGTYALAMVSGFISRNRATSLVTQYLIILLVLIYSLALIFFYREHTVNPDVKSFWDSLYFCCMNMVTVGCYFNALTPVGKVISVICPIAGMLLLPMFTVLITSKVQKFDKMPDNIS